MCDSFITGKDHFGWNTTVNEGISHGYENIQLYDGLGNGKSVSAGDDLKLTYCQGHSQWHQWLR